MFTKSKTSGTLPGFGGNGPIGHDFGAPKIPGAKSAALVALKLVTVIDGTGSSGPFSAGIVQLTSQFTSRLPAAISQVDFGLCVARDLDYDDNAVHIALSGATVAEVDRATSQIVFEGGGDADETFLDAIMVCINSYPWSYAPGYRRAIVFLGSSSSKPTRDGMTVREVADAMRKAGIRLFVVATPGSNMHDLAQLAGGFSFELSNSPSPGEVDRVCKALSASVTNSVMSGGSGTLGGGTQGGGNPVGLNGTRIIA